MLRARVRRGRGNSGSLGLESKLEVEVGWVIIGWRVPMNHFLSGTRPRRLRTRRQLRPGTGMGVDISRGWGRARNKDRWRRIGRPS